MILFRKQHGYLYKNYMVIMNTPSSAVLKYFKTNKVNY